jgi:hypothetical protein
MQANKPAVSATETEPLVILLQTFCNYWTFSFFQIILTELEAMTIYLADEAH